MLKSYRYRLYPSPVQAHRIEQHFGCCRMIWNLALDVKRTAWASARINVSRMELQRQLVDLKHSYQWLYEINAQSLQSVLFNLDNAFNGFFAGKGYPSFKKKSGHQSFQRPQRVRVEENSLTLPKIGKVKCKGVVPFNDKIKTVTISRTPTGKYFSSILIDDGKSIPVKPVINPINTIGIDLGIKSFVITSDGHFYESNRFLKNSLARLEMPSAPGIEKEKRQQ